MPSFRIHRFDDFTLDPAAMRLFRGSEELALEPKSFRLLQFLIENRDRVLGKEEIFRVVWQETSVTDNALTRAIAQIRKVLDDDPRRPRYIDTLPTVGYRFIGTLTEEEPEPTPKRLHKSRVWIPIGATILALVGLAAWHLRPQPSQPPVSAPIPFTTYRGSEDWPSFSPDGTQVAFQWDGEKGNNVDIYARGLAPDAAPLRLTTDPAPDEWPAWSPDGATIAFVRIVALDKAALMLIPALGGPERKLAEFPTLSNEANFAPEWSADSKWLVLPGLSDGNGGHVALFRTSVETGETTQITHPDAALEDLAPSISPDGATLLFVRRNGHSRGDLYKVRIDQNINLIETPHPIPSGEIPISKPAWTADGKIVVNTPKGAVRIPAEGSDSPEQVPLLSSTQCCFDLSRRGNRMVYSVVHGDANIWRIDLTAKVPQPERLVASTVRDVYPQYSPDGRQLAFYSNRSTGSTDQTWVSDAEGKQPRQLTFVKRHGSTPHWSPDGRTIMIDSNETGIAQIYTLSSNGGKLKQLTQSPSPNFDATWSRDGRWIYFTSTRTGRSEVWKMPDGGGPAIQITHNGGLKGIESEDGKTLYFGKEIGAGSIWKMPAAGGPEEQIADSLYRDNFAVTKKGIYYMTSAGYSGTSTLKLYSFPTGTTTTILPIGVPEYGLDVSPDGRYLAYDQLDDPASDLMLVNNFH